MPDDSVAPADGLQIDIAINDGDWGDEAALHRLVHRAVSAAMAGREDVPPGAELSVLFTDDREIAELNQRFRGRDTPTNVLSFPAATAAGPPLLGDIVLARETIDREARDQGLTLDHHITHLLVHGFLHLLGFDHESEQEALVMEGLETAILAGLGIDDPYRADAGPQSEQK